MLSPRRPSPLHPYRKHCLHMGKIELPRIIGWTPLWSTDRNTLVQLFTDLDTGSTITATVSTRRRTGGIWESTKQVRQDHQDIHSLDDHHRDTVDG